MANQNIPHMHKALTPMNVQIQHVISEITGVTGLAIVDSIIDGQRDPAVLAKLRDPHIKASEETIGKSLEGNWRREHLFTLQQSRKSYQHYQSRSARRGRQDSYRLVPVSSTEAKRWDSIPAGGCTWPCDVTGAKHCENTPLRQRLQQM
jgi:hypothetical protein